MAETHPDPPNTSGVKSVSVDGRSVTYKSQKEILAEQRAQDIRDRKRRSFSIGIPQK